MAEYRLAELARLSGVSARNIRAYRERGLLDPPRRVGRSAYYDEYHLSQLHTINELHGKGFSSAHIAEFFATMRQGADLADILGVRRAVQWRHSKDAFDIDPDSDEARRLIECGLAELTDGAVVPVDPTVGEILGRMSDQLLYVRVLLHFDESTQTAIDSLADGFSRAVNDCARAKFGEDYSSTTVPAGELGQLEQDCRELWRTAVLDRLDRAVRQATLFSR